VPVLLTKLEIVIGVCAAAAVIVGVPTIPVPEIVWPTVTIPEVTPYTIRLVPDLAAVIIVVSISDLIMLFNVAEVAPAGTAPV
jgi:hypothetical protein